MNLSDIVGRYTNPATTVEVDLPLGEKVTLRRITNTSEFERLQNEAIKWGKDARALAPQDDEMARKALGELAGDEGAEIIIRAYMLAEAIQGDDSSPEARRYGMCKLAAYSAPIFKILWDRFALSFVAGSLEQVADAVEGKAGCGQTPPCDSSCESPETCGASTPTN
jgi:hypothetical protein